MYIMGCISNGHRSWILEHKLWTEFLMLTEAIFLIAFLLFFPPDNILFESDDLYAVFNNQKKVPLAFPGFDQIMQPSERFICCIQKLLKKVTTENWKLQK